ncbi:MAG: class I SAM-dependent methyltransferase [Crocosphaera sp.]
MVELLLADIGNLIEKVRTKPSMLTASRPEFHQHYWQNSFDLETHLKNFLDIDTDTLKTRLEKSREIMSELGESHFDWDYAKEFYENHVGENYILELGAWHLESYDYIGKMTTLIADFAEGSVLDFGGGIGTHTIAAALCPQVTEVKYIDINPINCKFVAYRIEQLGLSNKVKVCSELNDFNSFDTIMCFDVVEHLLNPDQQLIEFKQMLNKEGKLLINWFFHKGFNNEFPFHLDDPHLVKQFFITLQSNFLELFHPLLISTRCYQKVDGTII